MMQIKKLLFILVIAFTFYDCVSCSKMPNIKPDTEKVEDWDEIKAELCKKEVTASVQEQIAKCHELDAYYKLDSYNRECEKLQAPGGSNWYNTEKAMCKVQECYDTASKNKDLIKINDEIEKMGEKDKEEKGYKKYLCIRQALGLKV